jgi:CMP-N,N'-diacetyllegionaminic acid synthase
MRILGLIPARGGSKGLPKKNIAQLGGKPLVTWTIEAGLRSSYITEVVVSTDDDEIKAISLSAGAKILARPAEISGDHASSQSAVMHAIEEYKKQAINLDYVVLLQPTSPFRNYNDIDNAFSCFFGKNANSLISVNSIDNKILKAFVKDRDGTITGVCTNEFPFMRRQDLPATFMSNGAIYIVKVERFVVTKSFYSEPCIPYEMTNENSVDIDSQQDLDNAEQIIRYLK